MSQLYFNPQNPLVEGNKASRPFVRFLNALAKAIGTGSGPILPGPITAAGLTMNTSRLLGRTSGGVGDPQEISVDSTLTLAAGVLAVATPATTLLQRATVTLTNAQIKALPSTYVNVGPAPGAGFKIRKIAVSLSLDATAGAYTNIDPSYAEFGVLGGTLAYGPVDDITAVPALTLFTSLFGTAARQVYDIQIPALQTNDYPASPGYALANGIASYASVSGTQAQAYMVNGAGDLTGGHASNSLKVTMYYVVEPI